MFNRILFKQKKLRYGLSVFWRGLMFLLWNEWKLEWRKISFFLLLVFYLFHLLILLNFYKFNSRVILERTNRNFFHNLRLDYLFVWSKLKFIRRKLLVCSYWRDRITPLFLFSKCIPVIRGILFDLLGISEFLHHIDDSKALHSSFRCIILLWVFGFIVLLPD